MSTSQDPYVTEPPREGEHPPAKPTWLLPVITGLGGFILGGLLVGGIGWVAINVGSAASHSAAIDAKAKILKSAMKECDLSTNEDAVLGDHGYTLTFNGRGDDDVSGLTIDNEACLLNNLKAPSAVISHIDQTTSVDGRQSETWGSLTMSWSYHPDRGLDGVLTVKK